MTENTLVKYNPKIHDGCLHLSGSEVIIADAEEAKLQEMPKEVRLALAEATVAQLQIMSFTKGAGGAILELTDPQRGAVVEEGYLTGLKLLGYEYDPETFALKDFVAPMKR